jgi:hypothetical protein
LAAKLKKRRERRSLRRPQVHLKQDFSGCDGFWIRLPSRADDTSFVFRAISKPTDGYTLIGALAQEKPDVCFSGLEDGETIFVEVKGEKVAKSDPIPDRDSDC